MDGVKLARFLLFDDYDAISKCFSGGWIWSSFSAKSSKHTGTSKNPNRSNQKIAEWRIWFCSCSNSACNYHSPEPWYRCSTSLWLPHYQVSLLGRGWEASSLTWTARSPSQLSTSPQCTRPSWVRKSTWGSKQRTLLGLTFCTTLRIGAQLSRRRRTRLSPITNAKDLTDSNSCPVCSSPFRFWFRKLLFKFHPLSRADDRNESSYGCHCAHPPLQIKCQN